jgi:hypothetical protein
MQLMEMCLPLHLVRDDAYILRSPWQEIPGGSWQVSPLGCWQVGFSRLLASGISGSPDSWRVKSWGRSESPSCWREESQGHSRLPGC